jgi:voltage-gated potassium channel
MPMLPSPDRAQQGPSRAAMDWSTKDKTKMTKPSHWVSELARVALPLVFVSLVAAAVAGITTPLFFAMIFSAALVIVVIRALFPAGRLFPIAFASLIAVYAAIFSLFVEEIFREIDAAFLVVGFCLPIVFFVVGCWLRRDQVRAVVAHPAIRSEWRVMRAAVWLAPVFLVGAAAVLLSRIVGAHANMDMVFLGAMSVIGLIVLTVSREVAIFLVDAGLLFEEFFARVSRLVIPAFAFFTFYSLIVILFASAYQLISAYTSEAQFIVGGTLRGLSFSESIYFSINTISTVGYGDIIPYSNLARLLSTLEVFCGIMLLLFGVSELLEYAREHRRDRRSE